MKILSIILIILATFAVAPVASADNESFSSWLFSFERKKEVASVKDDVYQEECGSCHFPYQPGLLPERSWKKLLSASALENHFKENAELDEETRLHIENYTIGNSADKSRYKRSRKVMASLESDVTPMRITEVPYIKSKHEEIPEKLIKGNDKVKALSFCDKCHQDAANGNFDDDSVKIPGYGNWTW